MTIDADTPRIQYTGNDVTVAFAFGFPIWAKGDLAVRVASTLKTVDVDYTVTFTAGDEAGGTVTFVDAPATSALVTITRDLTVERDADFPTSGAFDMDTLNEQLDKLTAQGQDHEEKIGRCVTLPPETEEDTPKYVGDLTAGEYVTVNTDGNLTNVELASSAGGGVALTDLASTANGKGASLVGVEDAGGLLTAATVEAALAEIAGNIDDIEGGSAGYAVLGTDLDTDDTLAADSDTKIPSQSAVKGFVPSGGGVGALAASDTTPSASGVSTLISYTGATATAVTDFDDPVAGQTLTVIVLADDTKLTFVHGSGLNLSGSANYNATSTGDTITFKYANSAWYEVTRMEA